MQINPASTNQATALQPRLLPQNPPHSTEAQPKPQPYSTRLDSLLKRTSRDGWPTYAVRARTPATAESLRTAAQPRPESAKLTPKASGTVPVSTEPQPGQSTGGPQASNSNPPPRQVPFTQDDLSVFMKHFGSTTGADSYSTEWDFDANGVIDFGDLNFMLGNIGAPKP